MSPKINATSKDVRSRYAALFQCVAELCLVHYGERPSTKFEDIQKETERLKSDNFLSDYLVENLNKLYTLYPEMLPGKRHSKNWLNNLYSLLAFIIADLYEEIKDVLDQSEAHDIESLWKSLENH